MSEHREVVDRASQGDVGGIEHLLAQYLPKLRAFIRLRIGADLRALEAASDVVQSACLDILTNLGNFHYRGEAQFRAWLFTATLRKLANKAEYHRAAKRDVHRNRTVEKWSDVAASYADLVTPSRELAAREELARVETAIDRLSDDHREVITLARICGLPHREIAVVMGRSEAACRVLLHRATAQLGMILAELERR